MTKVLEALEKISNTKCYEKESSGWDYIGYLCSDEIAIIKGEIERNVPMKPHYEGDGYYDGNMVYDTAHCPCCNKVIEEDDDGWKEPYCCHCGQRLDWSDVE